MANTQLPSVSGFWYLSAGRSNDLKTAVGFVCRYDCLLGPVRCELWRSDSGALFIHTYVRRFGRWRLRESVESVPPSDTTAPPVAWNVFLTWLDGYMAATATVYGSWLRILKRRLLA